METNNQRKGHIYIIKNTLNSKVYIGQAIEYRKHRLKKAGYLLRWREHLYSARTNPTYHMDRVMKELGTEFFSIELLEECDANILDEREIFYILKHRSQVPNGYNVVLGNPHKSTNPEHTSMSLKKYYDNEEIKQRHSQVHMNKFTPISSDKRISRIDIKPISQSGSSKIVYMYITYEDGSKSRRRYGGIHISFDDAYKRCLADSQAIAPSELIIDHTKTDQESLKALDLGVVDSIRVVHQQMRGLQLVAIIISSKNKKLKRIVFGGKTISYPDAYSRAMSFIKKVSVLEENVEINPLVMATLSNCRRVP